MGPLAPGPISAATPLLLPPAPTAAASPGVPLQQGPLLLPLQPHLLQPLLPSPLPAEFLFPVLCLALQGHLPRALWGQLLLKMGLHLESFLLLGHFLEEVLLVFDSVAWAFC